MALFSRDKKEAPNKATLKTGQAATEAGTESKKDAAPKKKATVHAVRSTDRDLSSVIIKPRITEKAVGMGEKNVYTFLIRRDATKFDVRDAVKELFGVTPVKVNIVNKSPRTFLSRSKGKTVSEKGMKKAYVYLKAGDSIELA